MGCCRYWGALEEQCADGYIARCTRVFAAEVLRKNTILECRGGRRGEEARGRRAVQSASDKTVWNNNTHRARLVCCLCAPFSFSSGYKNAKIRGEDRQTATTLLGTHNISDLYSSFHFSHWSAMASQKHIRMTNSGISRAALLLQLPYWLWAAKASSEGTANL